jgi:folate-binding protein YgfZ
MIFNSDLGLFFNDANGVRRARPEAWLRVSGPDAAVFLQGQCTQDLRGLKPGQTAWALWLSIKGRVQAESLILRGAGDVWWLWSAHSEGAALAARLEEFIIADDLTVENASGATEGGGGWEQVTLAGEAAEAWLRARRGGENPPAEGAWVEFGGGLLFAGRRGRAKIWEWLRPVDGAGAMEVGALTAELGELREEALVRGRIAAGVAAIPGEFGAQDLPQEAGLEEVAISFTKGCYLGQEVMARLHAMGRVRRRLVRVAGAGGAPASGAGIFARGAPEKAVGDLRAAVDDGRGGWIGLAMVNVLGLAGAGADAELLLEGGRGVRLLDAP